MIHVVADYGPDEQSFAELRRWLAVAEPGAEITLTQVAGCDSLAAGFCAARLALGDGATGRVVVQDVAVQPSTGKAPRECVGWVGDCVAMVGPDAGWSWSFVATEISGPCYLELPANDRSTHSPELLAEAVVRGVTRHPHALCGAVPLEVLPAVPEPVVAYVYPNGNIATTIREAPTQVGKRILVRIGDATTPAIVSDDLLTGGGRELVLGPASSAWRLGDGRRCPFQELCLPGGSAAELFHAPRSGEKIVITSHAPH